MPGYTTPASQLLRALGQLLGTYASGDVGDVTLYTTRHGRLVMFKRTSPDKPPTARQIRQRRRFTLAQADWMQQPGHVHALWEAAMIKCGIDMTGQNAWISQALRPDPDSLAAIAQRCGIVLQPPNVFPD